VLTGSDGGLKLKDSLLCSSGEVMFEPKNLTPAVAGPQGQNDRVELANQLFREFHTRCFWHSPRDLVITEELIPFVVKNLRKHGGRHGFMLAGELLGIAPS
jgi:hypothetical protein